MLDAATSSWVPFKSFSVDGTWEDFWYDMVVVIASIGAGIAAYFFVVRCSFMQVACSYMQGT
jgi:hypothetical protein